ncbi:AI-2E family transporter [Sphingobium sp. AN641]|uniref:AI-2E family transporter n=1 Tax=Sphingobium sp. AN641 TaxID=3133443 RepID=UPI0030C0F543
MIPRAARPMVIEDSGFALLVILISLAFAWVIEPFFGAILWGLVTAILFAPLNRWFLAALPGRRNSAAMMTLLVIIALVIVPAFVLGMALVQEASGLYARIQSGDIDFARYFRDAQNMLPAWAKAWLQRSGLTSFANARQLLGSGMASGARAVAGQAFLLGQGAFSFLLALGVMLYLSFYLLRDGDRLLGRLDSAVPLRLRQRRALASQFVTVIRATMKGSIVVAIVQGMIGGMVFWTIGIEGALLWGVVMGIFSLLPAVGTGLVWVPVAIYLFLTGAIWQGAVLVGCGVLIIGMVDNILRPILVGRDTRMPDYVVLISTLGGLEAFGINGFVIGPAIAALFIAVWNILTEARGETPPLPAIAQTSSPVSSTGSAPD